MLTTTVQRAVYSSRSKYNHLPKCSRNSNMMYTDIISFRCNLLPSRSGFSTRFHIHASELSFGSLQIARLAFNVGHVCRKKVRRA